MIIVKKSDLSYFSEREFRDLHPNVSFPATLSNDCLEGTGFEIPEESPLPELGKNQSALRGEPYKQGNKIKLDWIVVDNPIPLEVTLKEFELAIDSLLNAKAREYKYDSVYTMISYRGDPNTKFAQEAESMFQWRSAVWTKANQLLEQYISNPDEVPTIEDILSQLPEFEII